MYHAKTGEYPEVQVLDQVEGILTFKGKTWDEYADMLQTKLSVFWKRPAGFITHVARTGFDVQVEEPKLKPPPKCPRCQSDKREGAVFENGEIIPCPDCSTPEWREKLAAKLKAPAQARSAGG